MGPTRAPSQHIVRVVTRLNVGGPTWQAMVLSAHLDGARFRSVLVAGQTAPDEGDLTDVARGQGIQLIVMPELRRAVSPWHDMVALVKLTRLLWRERPAIVHTHMAKAGTVGRLAGMLYNTWGYGRTPGARAMLVHTFHGHVFEGYFSPWLSRAFVTIERWLARRTDCLIAVSRQVQHEVAERGVGRPDQWRVIPVGVDLSRLAQLALPNGTSAVRIGMIGRLVSVKNPGLFLDAFSRLRRKPAGASVSGVVVGDGPLRQRVEQEAKRLGLTDIIRFAGWQRDLASVYQELEIACLTSWNEGTPVALIEAMAAGRAVVATNVGGVRDLLGEPGEIPADIPHGGFHVARRGVLVRAGDADGLAAALERLASDDALRQRLAEAARPHVLGLFATERLLRDITALYGSFQPEA